MENKFTNKNTLDEAWSMMNATLDKEMPVSRKRRAIWWWIPFGLGLLAIASLVYVMYTGNEDDMPQQQIQNTVINKPIADNEVKSPSTTTINQSEKINKQETKSIENKKTEKKSTSIIRPNNKNKAITKTNAPLKTLVQNQPSKKQDVMASTQMKTKTAITLSEKNTVEMLVENQNLVNPNASAEEAGVIENKLLAKKLDADVRPASNLVDPLPILNNLQFDWETQPNAELPRRRFFKWDLGLKTAVLSDVNFDSPTLLVEGQIIRKIGTRWSIVSGLGIKSQNLKLDERLLSVSSIGADQASDGISIFGLGGLFSDNRDAFTTIEDNSRSVPFNFLYIPIGVKYNFKGRWSLNAGAHYNFLELSSGSSIFSRSEMSQDGNGVFNLFRSSQSILTHFYYYLSVHYRLGKRASLLAQYQGNTGGFRGDFSRVDANQFGIGMHWQF